MHKNDSWRIKLLSDVEVAELYALPKFDEIDREYYFSINENENKVLTKLIKPHTRLYFILQLGYFRAKKMFYKISSGAISDDILHIKKRYFSGGVNDVEFQEKLPKDSLLQQKVDILRLFQYQEWSNEIKPDVVAHLRDLIKLYPKGNDTLRELFVFLENKRITIPSYRTLQDLFTEAFSFEMERLSQSMLFFPKNIREKLDELIKNDDGFTPLNIVRSDQKDFNYRALRNEVKKAQLLSGIYELSKTTIPSLGLSTNAVRYYASLAEHYTASRMRKLRKPLQWLHTLCFVFHRYQSFMNNLITSFMVYVKLFMRDATDYAKLKEAEYINGITMEFPKLVQFLKWFSSDEVNPDVRYQDFSQVGFEILPKETLGEMADYIAGIAFDYEGAKWEFYEKSARKISLYLRPILLAVNFEFYKPDSHVMRLIDFLRRLYNKPHDLKIFTVPDDIVEKIPKKTIGELSSSKKTEGINPARFEFYTYKKIYHELDRGRLFCNDSISYCDLDYDLVSDKLVDQVHTIAEQFGYKKLAVYCDERLDQALLELDTAWKRTNGNIESNVNKDIKIQVDEKGNTTWQLTYDTEENEESKFFSGLPKIDIADAVKIVCDKLNVWSVFTHLKHRYIKCKQPESLALLGATLSSAFGFGTKHMADISNLSYNHLRDVENDFIHNENLLNVSDVVSNFIYELPVNRALDLMENKIVGDCDGQKFETSSHTIQSRYSSKYFGTCKGISVYSLIANNIAINAKNIGPNEYEGHHLFDMVYGNHTDIPIDMITGDGHSINQVNFVALDVIDVAFIPSINDIQSEAEKLSCMYETEKYDGLIKPHKKVNVALIKSEKRGIIRILLSLILQENTQAVIIQKLSSHKRYSRLQAALWEYNKIFNSTHILNVINDVHLRKVIKKARNRTESYHQMQRAIRKVHKGIFGGRKIVDNAICTQASRFVANCIVAYNTMLLNAVYLRLVKKIGEEKAKEIMRKISPVAWRHFIFTGKYRFTDTQFEIVLDEFVDMLEQKLDDSSK
jgi:TnpA family transposase